MSEKEIHSQNQGINTKVMHGYPVTDYYTGAASIPKYQTSTFDQRDMHGEGKKYNYSRFGNPTIDVLQSAVAHLEKAKYAFVFSSGMAAISAALMLAGKDAHIVFPVEVYGGTYQFASEILPRLGISSSFLDYDDIEGLEESITDSTKILYIETPSNPLLKVADIKRLVGLAEKHNLITIADNTFMSFMYQNPLELGVDIVIESMTKFMNGHSDVVAGAVATSNEEYAELFALFQKNFGAILGVEDAWLILRGLKTMGIRMQKSVSNAKAVAEFLNRHPKIKKVYYPGLESFAYYALNHEQADSGGAVLSFSFEHEKDMQNFLKKMRIPIFAVSLGGVESIVSHPATMSHACMSQEERKKQGIEDTLLRLSCGIEDIEDLLADFEQALEE